MQAFQSKRQIGFTIVELLIAIVVIGILVTIAIVAYNGIQQRATSAAITLDLRQAANAFEIYKVDNGNYPTSMPADVKTSQGIVLSATATEDSAFCINAYNINDYTVKLSWDSGNGGVRDGWCSGAIIGTAAGGEVPTAPRGPSLAVDFSQWTLTNGATYDASTGELTLGASGRARSPLMRVDSPAYMSITGDYYATVESPRAATDPSRYGGMGAYHTTAVYYGNDGTTRVQNTDNYTENGCARPIELNTWAVQHTPCGYLGGPNVVYAVFAFYGSNSGFASSDLKIRNPTILIRD